MFWLLLLQLFLVTQAADTRKLTSQANSHQNKISSRRQHAAKQHAAKTLESLHHYLVLESAHSARSPIIAEKFSCTFKSYWTRFLKTCVDGTLHEQTKASRSKLDVDSFCSSIRTKCQDGDDDLDVKPNVPILPTPTSSKEDELAPLPWCTYTQVMPPDTSWIVIAADDGVTLNVDGRPSTLTIISKTAIRATFIDDGQSIDIPWSELETKIERPSKYPAAMNDFSSKYMFEKMDNNSPDFFKSIAGDALPSQLEPFAFETSKADHRCDSENVKEQESCLQDPACQCQDALLWLRVVTENTKEGRPQCLVASKEGLSTKWGSVEVADCSSLTLWVTRKSRNGKENGDYCTVPKVFGKCMGTMITSNYQLISVGDSRDSNSAGTALEALREPARCLVRDSVHSAQSRVHAIRARYERSCVLNKKHLNPKKITEDDCRTLLSKGLLRSLHDTSNNGDDRSKCESYGMEIKKDEEGNLIQEEETVCLFLERPLEDEPHGPQNYCEHNGAKHFDIKKSGIVCEDGCRNCLDVEHLNQKNSIDHCFETIQHGTKQKIEVVSYTEWEKNHPFRDDPFETMQHDMASIKEAGRRSLGRMTMGLASFSRYQILENELARVEGERNGEANGKADEEADEEADGEADEEADGEADGEAGDDSTLKTALEEFIKFFTTAKTKVSDYEHPKRVQEWNANRMKISNRFKSAGVDPCGHSWCPQSCNDVLTIDVDPTKLDVPSGAQYSMLVKFVTKRDDGVNEEDGAAAAATSSSSNEDESNDEEKEQMLAESDIAVMIDQFTKFAASASSRGYSALEQLKKTLSLYQESKESKNKMLTEEGSENEEVEQLINTAYEMVRTHVNPETKKAAMLFPTVWTFAMCNMADCYAGTGDERAMLQAKARSEDSYSDSTTLSMSIHDSLLESNVKTLSYKTLIKICEIRFSRKLKWWERKEGESSVSLLEVTQRHRDHINMLLEMTPTELFDTLPSLERLEPNSNRLNELCDMQFTSKEQRLGKIENCKQLQHAHYCTVNGAIIDLVPKKDCIGKNRAWCAFKQSMLAPCLYEDCLDPQERAMVPVRCEESHTAFGHHKEWVCGYRTAEEDNDKGCDCSEMRKIETGLAHRMFMGVADWFRKNPWLVVGVAAVILATGICLAFPACMAMMGVQSTAVAGTADTMSAMSETFGCGGDGVKNLVSQNPGVSAAGGGWYGADKLWVRGINGRLTSVSPGEGMENMIKGGAGTATNAAKFLSRKIMTGMPNWVPGGAQAKAVSEGMKTLGTSHPGMAFNPHYIKSSATIMIPPSCANFGKGVNYLAASAKIAGKFAGMLMTAQKVFQVGQKIASYLSTVGIKSYKEEFKTETMFQESMPFQLTTSEGKCLGREGKMVECSKLGTLWRGENREKDGEDEHMRLYHITTRTTTRGEMSTKYFVDEGVEGGFGPGKCLGYERKTLTVVDCRDKSKGTDWELKTNGMLCLGECRECLISGDGGALEVAKCGVAKKGDKLNNLKRAFGGGEYTLDERIIYFKANPAMSFDNNNIKFLEAPSPRQWRKCNWLKNGETFLNDEWPLITRSDLCTNIQGCGFDENTGLCRPVVMEGTGASVL